MLVSHYSSTRNALFFAINKRIFRLVCNWFSLFLLEINTNLTWSEDLQKLINSSRRSIITSCHLQKFEKAIINAFMRLSKSYPKYTKFCCAFKVQVQVTQRILCVQNLLYGEVFYGIVCSWILYRLMNQYRILESTKLRLFMWLQKLLQCMGV